MRIALDFDGTYDRAPELWSRFVFDALSLGHEVAIVTMRRDNDAERIKVGIPPVPVVYCARKAKKECWNADVWIDDQPNLILEDENRA